MSKTNKVISLEPSTVTIEVQNHGHGHYLRQRSTALIPAKSGKGFEKQPIVSVWKYWPLSYELKASDDTKVIKMNRYMDVNEEIQKAMADISFSGNYNPTYLNDWVSQRFNQMTVPLEPVNLEIRPGSDGKAYSLETHAYQSLLFKNTVRFVAGWAPNEFNAPRGWQDDEFAYRLADAFNQLAGYPIAWHHIPKNRIGHLFYLADELGCATIVNQVLAGAGWAVDPCRSAREFGGAKACERVEGAMQGPGLLKAANPKYNYPEELYPYTAELEIATILSEDMLDGCFITPDGWEKLRSILVQRFTSFVPTHHEKEVARRVANRALTTIRFDTLDIDEEKILGEGLMKIILAGLGVKCAAWPIKNRFKSPSGKWIDIILPALAPASKGAKALWGLLTNEEKEIPALEQSQGKEWADTEFNKVWQMSMRDKFHNCTEWGGPRSYKQIGEGKLKVIRPAIRHTRLCRVGSNPVSFIQMALTGKYPRVDESVNAEYKKLRQLIYDLEDLVHQCGSTFSAGAIDDNLDIAFIDED